jgi:hypothetical protein
LPLFNKASKEEEFWAWFQKNEDLIFNFEKDQERVFRKLQTYLQQVNRDLEFEFSGVKDNKREFVISAGGMRAAFPAVETLFKSAPVLPRWIFVKFRPRREPGTLMIGDVQAGPDDIEVALQPDGGKVGLDVFIKGFSEEKSKQYTQLAFILLDHTIGEYDMETKVGNINIQAFEKNSGCTRINIIDFPAVFDEFLTKQNFRNN